MTNLKQWIEETFQRTRAYRREPGRPLEIPARAVVVVGTLAISGEWGRKQQLSVYTPVIVKCHDAKTEGSVQLEEILR